MKYWDSYLPLFFSNITMNTIKKSNSSMSLENSVRQSIDYNNFSYSFSVTLRNVLLGKKMIIKMYLGEFCNGYTFLLSSTQENFRKNWNF
jgi:hypothetical protein